MSFIHDGRDFPPLFTGAPGARLRGGSGRVCWNFKHIVKVKTRRLVAATTRLAGYKELEIWTPEEVIDDDDES